MSGDTINRSMWLMLLPLILLFSIVFIILMMTSFDWGGFTGQPLFISKDIASGLAQALPFMVPGIVIGMLIMIYSMARRRNR